MFSITLSIYVLFYDPEYTKTLFIVLFMPQRCSHLLREHYDVKMLPIGAVLDELRRKEIFVVASANSPQKIHVPCPRSSRVASISVVVRTSCLQRRWLQRFFIQMNMSVRLAPQNRSFPSDVSVWRHLKHQQHVVSPVPGLPLRKVAPLRVSRICHGQNEEL